jgi:uncharacterized protein YdhG (YjbR/CyaY superfamily)
MRNYSATDVDDYIASAPAEARPKLREMRTVVRSAAPGAEEGISWGIPFYKLHGLLAGYAAFKKHVSFGFAAALKSEDRKTLAEQGYITGKKTVQIRFDQKVPVKAIKRILKAKVRMNEAKRTKK